MADDSFFGGLQSGLQDLLPNKITYATPEQIKAIRGTGEEMLKSAQRPSVYTWGNAVGDIGNKIMGAMLVNKAGELEKGGLEKGAAALATGGGDSIASSSGASSDSSGSNASSASSGADSGAGGGGSSATSAVSPPGDDTLGFIKKWEGFDPVAKWDYKQYTGGYGTRADKDQTFTPESAHAALVEAVNPTTQFIKDNIKVPLTREQQTAFTSFAHNLGTGEGGLSDLLPDINRGDWNTVAERMTHYNKAGGKVLPNLVQRRAEEARLVSNYGTPQHLPSDAAARAQGAPPTPATPSPAAIAPMVNALAGIGGAAPQPAVQGAQISVNPNAPGSFESPVANNMMGTLKGIGAPPAGGLASDQQAIMSAMRGGPAAGVVPPGAPPVAAPATPPMAPAGGAPGAPSAGPGAPGPAAMTQAIAGPQAPAGGGGARIPPSLPMSSLPSDAQIQNLMKSNIPQYVERGKELAEYKQKMLTPQQVSTPDGSIYVGTPYTGYSKLGLQGMPQLIKSPFKIPGAYEGDRISMLGTGPGGGPALVPVPTVQTPGGATPAAGGGAPGAGGLPPMPPTSDVAAMANWGTQVSAQRKAAEASAEETAKGAAKPMTEAMEKASTSPDMIRKLDIMSNAYKQTGISGGPLGPLFHDMRGAAAQLGLIDPKDKTLTAQNIIEKVGAQLAFQATKELTSRPAASEVQIQLKNNPGLLMNNQAAMYMLDLMKQTALQDQKVGQIAMLPGMTPSRFAEMRDKFYQDNPLISPFTHRPINEPGGGIPGTKNGPLPQAPGAQPGAPAAATWPAVGTVRNGYRFKGGNPAQQGSWEAVR